MTTGNEHRSPLLESENPAVELPGTSPEPIQQNREDQSPSVIANSAHEPDAATPSSAAEENTTEAGVNKNGEGPSAPLTSQNADAAKVFNMGLPEKSSKDLESRLSNFLGDYKTVKTAESRSYDYEEKYDLDKEGEENGPDARVFKVYNDEAEKYDEDMVRGFRDTLDALLVFAALFSAVVTTFVAQTSQALQTDQAQVTNYLLLEQIQLLRANGNGTIITGTSSSTFGPDTPTYSNSDVWINALFFTSLALSLATALLSVLAKQWIQAYMAVSSGSARDVALVRQLRYSGLMKWKLPEIIGALPLILHVSLAVFSVGLFVFLWSLYPALSWIIVSISGLSFAFYLGSIIIPAVDLSCPYRIPILYAPSKYALIAMMVIYKTVFRPLYRLIKSVWSKCYPRHLVHRAKSWISALWSLTKPHVSSAFTSESFAKVDRCDAEKSWWTTQHWSLNIVEKLRVAETDNNYKSLLPLAYDAILWLHDMSSNTTVRRIAVWSIAGHFFKGSVYLVSGAPYAALWFFEKSMENMIPSFFQGEDIQSHNIALRATENLRAPHIKPWPQIGAVRQLHRSASEGRANHVSLLLDHWKVNINATDFWGKTPLCNAIANGRLETVMLLLERGADAYSKDFPNSSALDIASGLGELDIAMLLLDRGFHDDNIPVGRRYSRALSSASMNGHLEIVKLLLDRADSYLQDDNQLYDALEIASYNGHLETVKLLLDRGANPNNNQYDGQLFVSALGAASFNGRLEIVKLLLDRGADVNIRDQQYGSALHAAVEKLKLSSSNVEVIKVLLAHGADVNSENRDGETVLQLAQNLTMAKYREPARSEVLKVLEAHIAINGGLPADVVHERGSLPGNSTGV